MAWLLSVLGILRVLTRRLLVFLCQVVSDHAAADGAEDGMMMRVMPGDTADNGALDAAFGISGNPARRNRQR